jgi:hypothetical protein
MPRRSILSLAALRDDAPLSGTAESGTAQSGRARSMAGRSSVALSLTAVLLAALAFACGSAGPYGYSRVYSPLDQEAEAARGAERYDPVMAHRLPEQWKDKKLELFGVVLGRSEARDGLTDLTLSVRRLAARNLCSAGEEDTCRVTVGDQELARVHALVALREGDAVGQQNLKPQALVRVVGKLEDHVDKTDGADVIVASYYRHWPAAEYVTEQARSYMRR